MSSDLPLDSSVSRFDPLYEAADRQAAAVPWANLRPCGWVADYASANPGPGTAAIVGCGLGDDAEVIAAAGYATTAFDVSQHAVDWCRERFPDSAVDYRVADLLELEDDLVGRFDLVVEVRTIQSLPPQLRDQAIDGVASLVVPGGVVLIVALARPDGTVPSGPPWAVSAGELKRFADRDIIVTEDRSESGHFVLEMSRSLGRE
jgi:SAM-dependent methyltransferase